MSNVEEFRQATIKALKEIQGGLRKNFVYDSKFAVINHAIDIIAGLSVLSDEPTKLECREEETGVCTCGQYLMTDEPVLTTADTLESRVWRYRRERDELKAERDALQVKIDEAETHLLTMTGAQYWAGVADQMHDQRDELKVEIDSLKRELTMVYERLAAQGPENRVSDAYVSEMTGIITSLNARLSGHEGTWIPDSELEQAARLVEDNKKLKAALKRASDDSQEWSEIATTRFNDLVELKAENARLKDELEKLQQDFDYNMRGLV